MARTIALGRGRGTETNATVKKEKKKDLCICMCVRIRENFRERGIESENPLACGFLVLQIFYIYKTVDKISNYFFYIHQPVDKIFPNLSIF